MNTTTTPATRSRVTALKLRAQVLRDELAECRTAAARACVTESLQDAERQLARALLTRPLGYFGGAL